MTSKGKCGQETWPNYFLVRNLQANTRRICKSLTFWCSFSSHLPLVSRAEILGNNEVFIKSGNNINLTCVAHEAPSPPLFINWHKAGSVINYSQRGGISILTEKQSKTSRLVIGRATPSDSGNYTCMPSNSGKVLKILTLTLTIKALHQFLITWDVVNFLWWCIFPIFLIPIWPIKNEWNARPSQRNGPRYKWRTSSRNAAWEQQQQ